uniref:Uncharacterized protein n=1 Tax=Sphaerodactylus townsendi TaxID=933632 RepID=A0ACB8FYI9_9SAUR
MLSNPEPATIVGRLQSVVLHGKPPLATDGMPTGNRALAAISAPSLADNQQFLANINCSFLLLMNYIRDKAGLDKSELIDLCEENGTLKLLFLVKFPEESATKFLTPRITYYICRVERGAPGTKQENGYRAFHPIFKQPPLDLIDSLRNQCDFLERSRLKMLRNQDGKKPPTMEALLSSMAGQVVHNRLQVLQ